MIHTFDPWQAPRIFAMPAVAVILVGGSVLIFALGQPVVGIVALGISGWISYHLIRFTLYQFRSWVRSSDDELTCVTSMGVKTAMPWAAMSVAGDYATKRSGVFLFVYDQSEDKLLSIPPCFTDRDELESRIRDHVDKFLTLSGATPDDLSAALKSHLDP